ncbi:MAG: sel1 repeat family protein [Selenomonadaceae bacterium]|nr:sel1 repeat family protein [Selenomonadaceae bacterium]
MNEVGSMYMGGTGVEKDERAGFSWIKKAAELKNPTAMAMTARMYELGIGTEQNISEALKWYVEAANAGEEHARQRIEMLFNERR